MTSALTLSELQARADSGEAFDYLLFWGHRQRADGVLTASCFSQWYPARFDVDGVACSSAEHFMMAEKARLFDDQATLAQVLVAPTPNDAKSAR